MAEIERLLRLPMTLMLATVFVLLVLCLQAYNPSWSYHLLSDVGVYTQRAYGFLQKGSWSGIGLNEYQPGALYFFLLPVVLTYLGLGYLDGMVFLNALLLAAHIFLIYRAGGWKSAVIALILFIASGPILFYRFEVFVSFLVLDAFLLWRRKLFFLSGVMLGWATVVKIYPVLLLPVLLIVIVRKRQFLGAAWLAGGFAIGFFIFIFAFLISGGVLESFLSSLRFHSLKPIGIESTGGVLLMLNSLFLGGSLEPVNAYGIHGLAGETFKNTFTFVTAAIVTIVLGVQIFAKNYSLEFSLLIGLLLLLVLVFFSTNFQPQYLFWPVGFIALLPMGNTSRLKIFMVAFLYGALLLFEQFIYPLGYTEYLTVFYSQGFQPSLVTFAVLGKIFFLWVLLLIFTEVVKAGRKRESVHSVHLN